MSRVERAQLPAPRKRLTPAEQGYVDAGELLDLDSASSLSGWSKHEVMAQPIAWVATGRGQLLLCRASLLAVMALRGAPNWIRPRTGPAPLRCDACGCERGSGELLVIDGRLICGDCERLATGNGKESPLGNTGSSGVLDSQDAPGSTIAERASPPSAETQACGAAPESDAEVG